MNQEFDSRDYDNEEQSLDRRLARREGFAVDLTGMGIRVAATIMVIGLGILIIYFALRPSESEFAMAPPTPEPEESEVLAEATRPLATFTPGPTSTPPPLDEPTPEPTTDTTDQATGLTVGSPAVVTGTNGLGVNMRQDNNTAAAVVQILNDSTPLTIVEGPTESENFTWWKVRLEDGTEGWVVQDYLSP